MHRLLGRTVFDGCLSGNVLATGCYSMGVFLRVLSPCSCKGVSFPCMWALRFRVGDVLGPDGPGRLELGVSRRDLHVYVDVPRPIYGR